MSMEVQIPALLGKNKPNNRPIDRPTDGYEGPQGSYTFSKK